jgi:hypothetical protein
VATEKTTSSQITALSMDSSGDANAMVFSL